MKERICAIIANVAHLLKETPSAIGNWQSTVLDIQNSVSKVCEYKLDEHLNFKPS